MTTEYEVGMATAKRFSGDSFIVGITPPSKAGHFPKVEVIRRKAVRKHGKVALGKKVLLDGLPEPPNKRQLAALARRIGEAVLNGSPITRKWMKGSSSAARP